jgi:hypothetical protein
MKRLLRIFDLSKNEQRVVLIVMLILITVAFIGYERRVHRIHVRGPAASDVKPFPATEAKPSPSPKATRG